ncbi:MAG: DUF6291 domain-containing protein [Bacteroidota bacterium]
MAENKKSFVLYCDIIHMVEQLPPDKAGELFLHILRYVNDKNPETSDLIVNIAFEPIKQQLKRDLVKYETYIEKQRDNGKRGGRPHKEDKSQKTQPFFGEPKKADNVNVNDNVNNNGNNNGNVLDFVKTKNILNSEDEKGWREKIMMATIYKNDNSLLKKINEFLLVQNAVEYFPHDISDTKRYFLNWIRSQKPELQRPTVKQDLDCPRID